jgi:hypothetical protein
VSFGREVCGDLAAAEQREWLVTNGLGGYASGTVAGPADPPLPRAAGRRAATAARPHAAAGAAGRDGGLRRAGVCALFSNRWSAGRWSLPATAPGALSPGGDHAGVVVCLSGRAARETRLDGAGANTTYMRYDLRRGAAPLTLSVKGHRQPPGPPRQHARRGLAARDRGRARRAARGRRSLSAQRGAPP